MKTILVVEDEFAIADMLSAVLEDEGYHVVLASNGREGLLRLADTEIHADLVLCDVMMPILDGREMRKTMKGDPELKDLPIVLMSAADETSASNNGISGPFLSKPFDLENLLKIIEEQIGKPD
jgi:two-component system alkaline phosphatase synthesis response regulator PhoP